MYTSQAVRWIDVLYATIWLQQAAEQLHSSLVFIVSTRGVSSCEATVAMLSDKFPPNATQNNVETLFLEE